jgi:hypothetical protein
VSGSAYTPRWRRALQTIAPKLFHVCLAGNYHWFWDLKCYCMNGFNGIRLCVWDSSHQEWMALVVRAQPPGKQQGKE